MKAKDFEEFKELAYPDKQNVSAGDLELLDEQENKNPLLTTQTKEDLAFVPNASGLTDITTVLAGEASLKTFVHNRNLLAKRKVAAYKIEENKRIAGKHKGRVTTEEVAGKYVRKIYINILEDLSNINVAVIKNIYFLFEKITQQAVFEGKIRRLYVVLDFQEMVDRGVYTTVASASRAWDQTFFALQQLALQIELKEDHMKDPEYTRIIPMFDEIEGAKGRYTGVGLNDKFPWAEFFYNGECSFITTLPKCAYAKNKDIFLIMTRVAYRARQSLPELSETWTLKMSVREICACLGIKPLEEYAKPARDVKKRILDALESINNDDDLKDYLEFDLTEADYHRTKDFVQKGKITVTLKGAWLDYFIERDSYHQEKREKIIALNEAKKKKKSKSKSKRKSQSQGE